ncbi:MAG: hypothetical protein J6V44_03715 [Methanobrevibacter sp.]|nr:hypothetical protein [Methanobrevibacter sp.]
MSTPSKFFEIKYPAFDEAGRYISVIPILLFNRITSSTGAIVNNDKNIEDKMMLCKNNKDTVVTCWYQEGYVSQYDSDYICGMNISQITGDLEPRNPDYDYEEEWI